MTHIRTLSLAAVAAALLLAGEAGAQRQVNARHDAAPNGTVEIQINNGSVRVVGWGRREVQVTGTTSRDGDRVQLEGGGRRTEVRVEGSRGRAGPVVLEVRVPAGSSLAVTSAGNVGITVTGVNGAVETATRNGPTVVQGSPRTVEITTQNGPVTLDGDTDRATITSRSGPVRMNGTVRQRAEVNAMNGAVEIGGSVGEVEISSLNGAVRVANVTGGRVEISSVSGSVSVTGTRLRGNVESVAGSVTVSGSLGGALNVESHAGAVVMRLPGNTGAEMQVTSWSGGVSSDWRLRREGREWSGTLGRGGPNVSITTFSGAVRITRR
ncbi:MAG TPA: DUF4097 family beta strand repeat-containing protein [Longimicrobium sp.]|nr:DUF4097 family beta strand repeat-containing protein [Longimicrobium sp.]